MSAPRLILKQPTGWFAAGREFAQALTLLSDGAFKLYVHVCLMANRHTGCLRATVEELARAMTRAPTAVAMNLEELEERAVCRVIRNGGSQLVLEIRDRFWPYQRQPTPERTLGPETEFIERVRGLFPVSYTHLDVYKRQGQGGGRGTDRSAVGAGGAAQAPVLQSGGVERGDPGAGSQAE